MSLRVKVWDLKRAVKYYSLYRGARYIDARYSESSLYRYDNACKLDDFCRSRSETSVNAKLFNNLHYVVDRLHIQGHVGAKCLIRNNPANIPANIPELKGVNTMV
jgi:hypothetical protein